MDADQRGGGTARRAPSKHGRKRSRFNRKIHGTAPPERTRPKAPPNPIITHPSQSTTAHILRTYYSAPGFGRVYTDKASDWPVLKDTADANNEISATLFPSEPATVGQLIYLAPDPATQHSAPLINFYLNDIYSITPLDSLDFEIYWMLPPADPGAFLRAALTEYAEDLIKHGFSVSAEGLAEAQIVSASISENPTLPVGTNQLIGDASISRLPPALNDLPYRHILTLPSSAPAIQALQILSSRQHDWRPKPADYDALRLCDSDNKALRSQTPVLRLTSTLPSATPVDAAWIRSEAFDSLTAPECFQLFREAALHTFAVAITNFADKKQAASATTIHDLPQAAQQLLQCLGALQPTTDFEKRASENSRGPHFAFSAVRMPYNPLQQQGQTFQFFLRHPSRPTPFKVVASAPRPSSEEKGHAVWHEYFKTALLLQSHTPLPLVRASHESGLLPEDSYLYKALVSRLEYATLTAPQNPDLADIDTANALTLKPAPDLAVVLAHSGEGTMPTNVVVALEDPDVYALLATNPVTHTEVQLHTRQHIDNVDQRMLATITVRPHHRSILGSKYHKLFTDLATQRQAQGEAQGQHTLPQHLTPLTFDAKKGLKGKRAHRLEWATAMIDHPLTLAYDTLKDKEHRKATAPEEEDLELELEEDDDDNPAGGPATAADPAAAAAAAAASAAAAAAAAAAAPPSGSENKKKKKNPVTPKKTDDPPSPTHMEEG